MAGRCSGMRRIRSLEGKLSDSKLRERSNILHLQSPAFRYPAASASAAVLNATLFSGFIAAAARQFDEWNTWPRRFPNTSYGSQKFHAQYVAYAAAQMERTDSGTRHTLRHAVMASRSSAS